MAQIDGPYLNFAVICEKVLQEADGVLSFMTAELAARKARLHKLGEYIAELEVPDTAPMTIKGGHVGLIGTTPDQLLGMVRDVQRLDEA